MLSKERKLEIYTERLWRLALDLALQASLGGKERHGIAIVAEETRNMGQRLYHALENDDNLTLQASMSDALMQLQALSLNGWIEMLRVGEAFSPMTNITKPIAVLLEEIRNVTNDIRTLFELPNAYQMPPQPELKRENCVTDVKLFLLQATIGGAALVENTNYIEEIIAYVPGDEHFGIFNGYLSVRGQKIPVIDCYTRFGLTSPGPIDSLGHKCAMIINTKWEKEPAKYAVLIDRLPLSFGFYSRFSQGQNAESRSDIFTDNYIRACWDTVDDEQMLFLDWKSLA